MFLTQLLQYAGYAVVFLTMISVLVAAHELGHYVFARWFGMGVEEFAIGFGRRPLFVWMRRRYLVPVTGDYELPRPSSGPSGTQQFLAKASTVSSPNVATAVSMALEGGSDERPVERVDTPSGPALRETTEFTVRPLPLGGFVRIKGMMPEEDGSETRIPGGFYSKAPWKRFLVLLAGPLFSVLAGVLVLIAAQMVNGQEVPLNKPVVADVGKDTPASRAGLMKGDQVISIDGRPIDTFYQIVQDIQASKGRAMTLLVDRNGADLTLKLTPVLESEPSPVRGPDMVATNQSARQYKMGASCGLTKVPVSFGAAVVNATKIPVEAVDRLIGIVRKPQEFSDNIAGPATIVSATAQATNLGIWAVIELAGLLSISVGILNLLPAPPLDGGQMVMAVAEMLRGGRRLSIRAQAIAGGIGLTFVAALIFAALAVDIRRFTTPPKPLLPPPRAAPAK